jgi:hypothetical protein
MAGVARPESSTSKVLVVFAIVLGCVGAYFVAPMFLPMWRWQNVDFHKLATDLKLDERLLRQEYDVVFRYAPRSNDDADPIPFQILTMAPTWQSLDEKNRENEEHLLVRCSVMSDRNGAPISAFYIGNTFKDRYFRAKCWRLPGGLFGKPAKRPILIYRALSFEKIPIGVADMQDSEIRNSKIWENDDLWEERDDGWDAGIAREEAAEAARKAAEAEEAAANAPPK